MATESKISNYFQTDTQKGDITHFLGHLCTHASIYKQTLLCITFGDDRISEFKMAVV